MSLVSRGVVLPATQDDDKLRIFYNDGNATAPNFTQQVVASDADGAVACAVADCNGDGDVDVLVVAKTDKEVRLFLNDGGSSPSFTEVLVAGSAEFTQPRGIAVADMWVTPSKNFSSVPLPRSAPLMDKVDTPQCA